MRRIAENTKNSEIRMVRSRNQNKEVLYMRILRPDHLRCTVQVFASGKLRLMGTRSESDARKAARKFAYSIKKAGHDNVKFLAFKIQTVMASFDLRVDIHLEKLKRVHEAQCMYEPEIHASLVYRVSSGAVLNVFSSGKVNITGVCSNEEVQRAFDVMCPVLLEFRKPGHSAGHKVEDGAAQPVKLEKMQAGDATSQTSGAPAANRVGARARGRGGERAATRGRGRGRGRARSAQDSSSTVSTSQPMYDIKHEHDTKRENGVARSADGLVLPGKELVPDKSDKMCSSSSGAGPYSKSEVAVVKTEEDTLRGANSVDSGELDDDDDCLNLIG